MPLLTAPTVPSIPSDRPATSRFGRETGLAAQSGPPDAPRHGEMKSPDLGRKTLILVPQHGFLPLDPVILDAPRCLIGSGADCRIRIAAKGIAEHHALILAGPHRVVLTAWDERTWLNEFPVRECTLRAGDRLAFGPIELLVRHATPAELARHSAISNSLTGAAPHDSVALPRALPPETTAGHGTVAAPRPAANPQPERTGHKHSDIDSAGRTPVSGRSARTGSSKSDSVRQSTGLDAGSNATELCDVLQQAIADGLLSASVTDLLRSPPTGGPVLQPKPAISRPSMARHDAPHAATGHAAPAGPQPATPPTVSTHSELERHRLEQRAHELALQSAALQQHEQKLAEQTASLQTREQDWTRLRTEAEAALSAKQAELRCQAEEHDRERIRLTNVSAELEQRTADVVSREQHVTAQVALLAETAHNLEQRTAALEAAQAALDKAVGDLASRQQSVEQQEVAVTERQTEADRRSQHLAEREQQLAELGRRLDEREEQTTAAEQCVAERKRHLDDRDRSQTARQRTLEAQAAQFQADVQAQLAAMTAERRSLTEATSRLEADRQALEARAAEVHQAELRLAEIREELSRREADLAAQRVAADNERQRLRENVQAERDAIARQVQQLAERAAEFDRRAAELQQLAAQLDQREEELQSSLESLGQRLAEISEQQATTDEERQALGGRASDLSEREQHLLDRQRYLDRRDQELADARMLWTADVEAARVELASERSRLADEERSLRERQDELTRRQLEFDAREQQCRDREERTRKAEATQVDLIRRTEEAADREQRLQRLEREFHARHEEWQVSIDAERQVLTARAAELAAALQAAEARARSLELAEQELTEHENSWRREVDVEKRALDRERQEFEQRRHGAASEADHAQQQRLAIQNQADELGQRQKSLQAREDELRELEHAIATQRRQIDSESEALRAEQTLVEQEWQRLKADRAPLDAERQRLRLAQEQLEAAVGRLDSDRAQLDADRVAFDRDLASWNAEVQERERRLVEAEAATRQPPTAGETGPSADVATTSGDVADRKTEDATSRVATPATSPTEDGWLLDDFMAMNPLSAAGNSIAETAPDADTSAPEFGDQAEAFRSQVTEPSLEADADSPNLHSYVQDLLHRMRSGRASEPFVHLPPEASPELTETARSAGAPDQVSAPEVEQDLLDSVNEIQDSVRSAVSPAGRTRPDSVEIRAGLGSLRELANYSARSALAQHTWKKTKSELAMKVSFVVGALVTAGGMDYFLSNSPRYSKLSILPLGFALLVAGDLALSYFRARRMFAASSAAGEAWQVEDTLDKSDAPTADLTPDASTGQPVQYTFEYDGEPAADTESRADR